MYKVLLADEEPEILNDRSKLILELGFDCLVAKDGEEAIKIIQKENPDVVLTDLKMPNQGGLEVIKATKEMDSNIPVIVFTGYGTIESAVQAMKLGAFDFIQKPFSPEMMEVVLTKAIEHRKLKDENVALKTQIQEKYQLENIVAKSKVMNDVAKRALKVAKSDANVLIYGESGTGKELIARSIHLHSQRCNGPFIPLDCVALPATLLESEIFGFEEGAFTGAVKSKPGVFELADSGTLFLDEIVELELNLQAKLLRVLQERQFRRIGGKKLINVNVRIIAATNSNPQKAVQEKKLRDDLYFRLNVVPIYIPPLCDRKEDIPLLTYHFIEMFNLQLPNEIESITKTAMQCLKRYNWPGNVRELQNVIEQAMSLTDKEIISLEDIPENIKENGESFEEFLNDINFKEAKDKYMKKFGKHYFQNLIEKNNGNISKAARMAGISRRTMYRMLQEFEIEH